MFSKVFAETYLGKSARRSSTAENTVDICLDRDFHNATASNGSETSRTMRCARLWYMFPFMVNLILLFSCSWLVNIVSQNVVEDVTFPLPSWLLFATIAVSAPASLAVSRLLPDPAVAVAFAGLLTSAGLLWTWFVTGPLQMGSLCVLAGAGLSFSVQAVGIALSPYFIRENGTAPLGTLLVSALIMFALPIIKAHTTTSSNTVFLYLCPIVFINSQLPLVAYLLAARKDLSKSIQGEHLHGKCRYDDLLPLSEKVDKADHVNGISCSQQGGHDVRQTDPCNGWALSIMSLIVWLTWGAGIDTTWLSLGWRYQYFQSPMGLPALQLLLCLTLLLIKVYTETPQPSTSAFRLNLASNYMQLGLLGIAGMVLCLFPDHAQPFHNHILFTVGCALQLDDLSDLCLVRSPSASSSVFKYRLISYQLDWNQETDSISSPVQSLCCKICHIVSILLMSVLSIILGVQIANILGALSTFPPLSFICSCNGLMVLSLVAICVALMGPKLWKGHELNVINV